MPGSVPAGVSVPSFWSASERPAGSGAPRFADSTPAASAAGAPTTRGDGSRHRRRGLAALLGQPQPDAASGRARRARRPRPRAASSPYWEKPASCRGDPLEVGQRGAAGGQRLLAAAQGRDQLAGAVDVLVVVELVVDGDHRRVVAGGQALGVLEGDRAVGGRLVVADAEVAADSASVDPLAAEHAAQRVRADADQVLAGRACACTSCRTSRPRRPRPWSAQLLGAERDAVGRDVALVPTAPGAASAAAPSAATG